jgi:hypothetical protein
LQCPGGGSDKSAIVGRMVNYPGVIANATSTVGNFGKVMVLVR